MANQACAQMRLRIKPVEGVHDALVQRRQARLLARSPLAQLALQYLPVLAIAAAYRTVYRALSSRLGKPDGATLQWQRLHPLPRLSALHCAPARLCNWLYLIAFVRA